MYFCNFVIISLWKRHGPLIWTNSNSLHPRMLFIKFGLVILEKILKFSLYIFPLSYLSLHGKGRGPSYEQIWIPFRQEFLVQSLVENGPEVFKNFVSVFLLFHYYLPLEINITIHLNKLEILFTQGYFVPCLVEIGPLVLEKKIFKILQCIFAIS